MTEDTAAKKVSYKAQQMVRDLEGLWVVDYPDNIDQRMYGLVRVQLSSLKTLIGLAGEVTE